MKKILPFVFLILMSSQAWAIDVWDTRQTVTAAWDAVPGATSYEVWVKAIEPEGSPSLRGEYTVTQVQVTVTEGKWVFGVLAKNAAGPSAIAWSDNPAYTYLGKTYGINYVAPGVIPAIPSGLKLVSDITPPIQEINLIVNGDFESSFVDGVAENWITVTDGGTYSFSMDTGHDGGFAQKMVVTAKNTWGMFFYQEPAFVLNKWYTVSFWYKAVGAGAYYAVTNGPHTQFVFGNPLPAASAWTFISHEFQYTNAGADEFRFSSGSPGTLWVDDVVLRLRGE